MKDDGRRQRLKTEPGEPRGQFTARPPIPKRVTVEDAMKELGDLSCLLSQVQESDGYLANRRMQSIFKKIFIGGGHISGYELQDEIVPYAKPDVKPRPMDTMQTFRRGTIKFLDTGETILKDDLSPAPT